MEVEQPLDVLPMHSFARGLSTDILGVMESWAAMPALPKPTDDDSHLGSLPHPLDRANTAPPGFAEEAKKRARNHRRDAHDRLKKHSGGVSEDDVRAKKSAIDEMVDEASKKITKLADEKKKAIETRQD